MARWIKETDRKESGKDLEAFKSLKLMLNNRTNNTKAMRKYLEINDRR